MRLRYEIFKVENFKLHACMVLSDLEYVIVQNPRLKTLNARQFIFFEHY